MLQTFFKSWWVLALKGLLLVVLGVLCFANPGVAFLTLSFWFSLTLMVDAVLSLIAVLSNWKETEDKWMIVLDGVVSFLLGFMLWRNPDVSLLLVAMTMAAWAFFSGFSRIAMAIQLRKEIEGEFWLGLSGVLLLILGVIIVATPAISVASLTMFLGFIAVVAGIALIMLGFKIRSSGHKLKEAIKG